MDVFRGRRSPRTRRSSTVAFLLLAIFFSPEPAFCQETCCPPISDSRVGFIDGAIPGNQARFRVDTFSDFRQPSKAEYFWPKSGAPFFPGPPRAETRVDNTDLSAYFESSICECLSGFVELPLRFVDPTINDFNVGLADVNAGIKYAFWQTDDFLTTFQFRTYFPTGNGHEGLGNEHFTVEPGLLGCLAITECLMLEGELRAWIPLDGTNFAGNHLRYGIGAYYQVFECHDVHVSPVIELIGWTLLDGKESATKSVAGQTYAYANVGLRVSLPEGSDIYAGYGQALTDKKWYDNTFRVEFRMFH